MVAQWAPLLATYLQATVGPAINRTFEVVAVDVITNQFTPPYKVWTILAQQPPVLDLFLANAAITVCAQK